MVKPSLLYLENSLKPNLNDSVFKSLLKSLIKAKLDFYIEKYEFYKDKTYLIAAFLNPKYKKFSHATQTVKKEMLDLIKKEFISDFQAFIKDKNEQKDSNGSKNNQNRKKINEKKKANLSDPEDDEDETT